MMLSIAIRIASQAFEGKFDKGGVAYIMHCLYVMHKVKIYGELAMVCAVLHDVVEDCEKDGYTTAYLLSSGISEEAVNIVKLLTKKKGTNYMDYIKAVYRNPIARIVKLADLEHNTKVSRLKGLSKGDFDRLEKYSVAYQYLK